ncbi:MAG: hypothetical protein ACXVCP_10975 [Bdellovibrio sp.]
MEFTRDRLIPLPLDEKLFSVEKTVSVDLVVAFVLIVNEEP